MMEYFEITVQTGDDTVLFFAGLENIIKLFCDPDFYHAISKHCRIWAVADGTALIDNEIAVLIECPKGIMTSQYLEMMIYAVQHPTHILTVSVGVKYRNQDEKKKGCCVTDWHEDERKYVAMSGLPYTTDPALKTTKLSPMESFYYEVNCVGPRRRTMFRDLDPETELAIGDRIVDFNPYDEEMNNPHVLKLLHPLVFGPEGGLYEPVAIQTTVDYVTFQMEQDKKLTSSLDYKVTSLPPHPQDNKL